MSIRKPIFDAVRAAAKPGLFNDPGNVLALDNLLDAFGIARDGARRSINKAGREIVKSAESLRIQTYLCPAGKPTIGWGHTGPDVTPGLVITEARAEELLAVDLAEFEDGVAKLVKVATDNQFSALVSFAFNLGLEALRTSTLLRKHNEGDYFGAKAEFAKWNKARVNGVLTVLNGLTRRRAAEAALYGSAT